MPPSPSYSTAYVAKRLGVSIPTVQRWVDAGRLKAWKTMGGHRRVDAHSAEQLFRQAASGTLHPEAQPVSVVIVDDNPSDRELFAAIVELHLPGARITTAENGYEGLLTIGRVEPDVVVTDILMPRMDGFEMIAQLVAHAALKPPVVFAMSSLTPAQLARRGRLPASVKVLSKPLEEAQVAAELTQALKQRQRA